MIGLLLAAMAGQAQEIKQRIALQRSQPLAPSNIAVMYIDGKSPQDLIPYKDTAGRRVTPALSPDGQTLCFSEQAGAHYQLFLWRLDDTNTAIGAPIQLTKDDTADAKFPSWSPDGKRLAYLSTDTTGKTSLRLVDVDGLNDKELLEVVNYNSATPSWGNNGEWVLFVDKIGDHLGLRQMPATGGMVQDIRPQSTITAASYSPDGAKIAALIRRPDGMTDLWVLNPPGVTGDNVCGKISGGRDVAWLNAQTIIFSAAKVGDKTGNAFWKVDTRNNLPSSFTGFFFNAKEISFFSVQKVNPLAESWTVADINNAAGPGTGIPRERLPQGEVTIVRPYADSTVRGIVPIKIIAQQTATSIVVRINGQFIYSTQLNRSTEDVTRLTFNWDTQELADIEPTRGAGLPEVYQDPGATKKPQLLRYPDGDYTLTVQALERDTGEIDRLLYTDSIKITLRNTIPNSELTGNILLRYQYREVDPFENFDLHGEGTLYGPDLQSVSTLNAKFNAQLRRTLVDTRPNGNFDLRTSIRLLSQSDVYPFTFGPNIMFNSFSGKPDLPEAYASALYSISPSGELAVVPQRLKKIYLPLAQVGLTFSTTPIKVGVSWPGQIWLVNDLLGRQGMQVQVDNTAEGLEWMGNRKTIRIRSDIRQDDLNPLGTFQLPLEPATDVPGNFDRSVPQKSGLKVSKAEGKRYTWFDYERNQIVRVEDFILYTFPLANVPILQQITVPRGATGTTPNGGNQPGYTRVPGANQSGVYAPAGGGDVPSSRLSPGGYVPPGSYQPGNAPMPGAAGGYAPMPGTVGGDLPPSRLAPGGYAPMPGAAGNYAPMPDGTGGYAPIPGAAGGYAPIPGAPGGYAPVPGYGQPGGNDVPPSRFGPGVNQPGISQPGVTPPPFGGTQPSTSGSITANPNAPKPRTGSGYYLVRWSYLLPQDVLEEVK